MESGLENLTGQWSGCPVLVSKVKDENMGGWVKLPQHFHTLKTTRCLHGHDTAWAEKVMDILPRPMPLQSHEYFGIDDKLKQI